MSAFSSNLDLHAEDVTGTGTEVDVAVNLLNGDIRLSILWTQEILLSADSADQVALALQQAAEQARRIATNTTHKKSPNQAQPKPE
ncbi:hypothetical protein [Streptomyces sp. NPDC127119]|uniref:hypothetical protein n=1 Tax=Streptomyces sp. NPDC127119 TaxID=3345370 RepID=UPI0036330838